MSKSRSSPMSIAGALAVLLKTCSTINRMAAALVLSACVVTAAAQSDRPAFSKFKSDMMPKVGQKITVVGIWSDRTKQCCWLAFNKWGAYVYATKESGIAKERNLFAHFHNGQTVKVTGTLRHFAEPTGKRTDKYGRIVQIPPEHFFFDAAEVEVSPW